ncbi:hypothetical protein SMJ63A_70128 [Stenotrophomonas geniculata]
MRQLAAQKTKKHLFLSSPFGRRLRVESAPLFKTVCQSDPSDFVGFLTQHKHRKGGERGDANADSGNYHSQHGYHYSPRIPPHHAICDAWFHARANSVPQLRPTRHSLPPWTRRHSAMAGLLKAVCRLHALALKAVRFTRAILLQRPTFQAAEARRTRILARPSSEDLVASINYRLRGFPHKRLKRAAYSFQSQT